MYTWGNKEPGEILFNYYFLQFILLSFLPHKGHTSVYTLLQSCKDKVSSAFESSLSSLGQKYAFLLPLPAWGHFCPNNLGPKVRVPCHFGLGRLLCACWAWSSCLWETSSSKQSCFLWTTFSFCQAPSLGDIPCPGNLGSMCWDLRGDDKYEVKSPLATAVSEDTFRCPWREI